MTLRAPTLLAGLAWTATALADPGPPQLLPRSSIAAVLAHRGELGLTDAEIARLEALDDALASDGLELRRAAGAPGRDPGARAAAADGKQAEDAGGGRGGPGMGGGRHGGGSGGRGERGAPPGGGRHPTDPGAAAEALRARLDDADTQAYLRAEEALAPAQRERAREIASEYRAALYDAREAARRGASR